MMRPPAHERGAALLAVLAMVVVLASLASLGLARLQGSSARIADQDQLFAAGMLASSGAAIGAQLIGQLKAQARSQPQLWQQPIAFAAGGGQLRLQFTDAGNCFNLNSLLAPSSPPGATAAAAHAGAEDFARLLQAGGVAMADAQPLADATMRRLQAGDLLWADASEWQAVPGVTDSLRQRLGKLICALPSREASPINLNSLQAGDAPLLMAAGLPADDARRMIAARPQDGWGSGGEFWQAARSGAPMTAAAMVAGTRSRWIDLTVTASIGKARATRRYLLDTAKSPARITASLWLAERGERP